VLELQAGPLASFQVGFAHANIVETEVPVNRTLRTGVFKSILAPSFFKSSFVRMAPEALKTGFLALERAHIATANFPDPHAESRRS
jgi:hypothetical protein